MAGSSELPDEQRRTLDRLRPVAEGLRGLEEGPGGFPIAGIIDLATMKLSALARRGLRRDFWDLFAILRSGRLALENALTSYVERYGVKESDLYHVIRAFTFFEDAEADPLLPEGLTPDQWLEIKSWFLEQAPRALRERIGQ